MLRYLVLTVSLSLAGPAWADTALKAYLLETVRHDPQDLHLSARQACRSNTGGQVFEAYAKTEGRDRTEFPDTGAYCLVLLRESERRGLLLNPYQNMGEASAALNAILSASGQGANHYTHGSGVQHALPCGMAFDAGYVFARANTSAPLPDLNRQDLTMLTEACFNGQASSFQGLLAGAHNARETR